MLALTCSLRWPNGSTSTLNRTGFGELHHASVQYISHAQIINRAEREIETVRVREKESVCVSERVRVMIESDSRPNSSLDRFQKSIGCRHKQPAAYLHQISQNKIKSLHLSGGNASVIVHPTERVWTSPMVAGGGQGIQWR